MVPRQSLRNQAPSLLINLLQDSSNNKCSEKFQTNEDKKVRLKLKMPTNASVTALPTPKLPSETSLSVVRSEATSEDDKEPPPKVPKLILSMRNKTVKTSTNTENEKSTIQQKRLPEDSQIQATLSTMAAQVSTRESKKSPESQRVEQCLSFLSKDDKNVNGSGIKTSNTNDASFPSSPASSISTSSSSLNSTKMVPVKLVTVTKGEGNVRLVRVSPVKSSSSAAICTPQTTSSNNYKNDNLVNGSNITEEVPSSLQPYL